MNCADVNQLYGCVLVLCQVKHQVLHGIRSLLNFLDVPRTPYPGWWAPGTWSVQARFSWSTVSRTDSNEAPFR